MDDMIQLRCRNAELEIELRLVKEQLAQAHGATNYLITTLSKQHSSHQDDDTARLRERLDCVQAENNHLRTALGVNGDLGVGYGRSRNITSRLPVRSSAKPRALLGRPLQSGLPPSPPSTADEHVGLGEATDLLSFDDGDSLAGTEAWSSPSPDHLLIPKAAGASADSLLDPGPTVITTIRDPRAQPIGLGIANVRYEPQSTITLPNCNAPPKAPDGEHVHTVENGDGSRSYVMMTPATSSFQTRSTNSPYSHPTRSPPSRAPTGPRWMVHQHDEMRLLNIGCFVEGWEDENWEVWAAEKGRYSAPQWRRYYEEVIRPRYLEIKAKKAAALGGGPTAAAEEDGEGAEVQVADPVVLVEERRPGVEDGMTEADDEFAEADDEATEVDVESQGEVGDSDGIDETGGQVEEGAVNDLLEPEVWRNTSAEAEGIELLDDGAEQAVQSEEQAKPILQASKPEEGLAASQWAPKPTAEPFHPHATEHVGTDCVEPSTAAMPAVEEALDHCPSPQNVKSDVKKEDDQHQLQTSTEVVAPVSHAPTNARVGEQYRPAQRLDTYKSREGYSGRSSAPYRSLPPPRQPLQPGHALAGAHPSLDTETKSVVFSHANPEDQRTVLVRNLPPNITLAEVLDKVRGGKIVSAVLARSAGMNTQPAMEMNAAMVTFLYARDAQQYVDFCTSKICIFFWFEYWAAPFKASVSLLPTASRHVDPALSRQTDASRILYLADSGAWEAEHVVSRLLRWGKFDVPNDRLMGVGPPLRCGRDGDGVLWFEFASMGEAGTAKVALEGLGREFGGMSKGFLPDPCARGVQGLVEVAEAKQPETEAMLFEDEGMATPEDDLGVACNAEQTAAATDISDRTTEILDIDDGKSTASSDAKQPAYVHTPVATAGGNRYKQENLELARAFLSSCKNVRAKALGAKQTVPPHLRARASRPRTMAREDEGVEDFYSAEVLKEDEAMGVEG
ncbi:hypothetical protein LTR36_007856 [Oleoguttula mirabilis]|uniref:Uncharacterized protein n=1 Tax=Oleoguttula mirabilis TaxID=1507867 RepID=A0AAV9J9A5_9PEZI|nr:hypothetical protein LTR36_007856 [Oleoguttula mirabilis]